MSSQHVPSSLSSAAPRRARHWRPVDREHSFLVGPRSQILPDPFGLFPHPAQSSDCRPVDRKHSFPVRWQIPGSLESFGPFLHRAQSARRALSSRRFASRPWLQVSLPSPRASLGLHGSSFQQPLSCLLVTAAPPAVAPTPLQPAPANSLSDRKSTRLNSSHITKSYAVFCLKK